MNELETLIREAFVEHDISAFNLFLNPTDEGFQANVSHRATGSFGITKHKDPVAALIAAMKLGIKKRKAQAKALTMVTTTLPAVADQFEELLG
jgi:hypothetical protein